VFGRTLQGTQHFDADVGYVYDATYNAGGSGQSSFGQTGGAHLVFIGRSEFESSSHVEGALGSWRNGADGLGGWSLDVHHAYDPKSHTLYMGDGTRRSVQS